MLPTCGVLLLVLPAPCPIHTVAVGALQALTPTSLRLGYMAWADGAVAAVATFSYWHFFAPAARLAWLF